MHVHYNRTSAPTCRLSGSRRETNVPRSGTTAGTDSIAGRVLRLHSNRRCNPVHSVPVITGALKKRQTLEDKDQRNADHAAYANRPASRQAEMRRIKVSVALIRRKIPLDRLRPVARYHCIRINYCRAINLHIFIHVPADDD